MKTITTFILLFTALLLNGQTWQLISPTTGLYGLNDVSMLNDNKGLAVGNNGSILQYNGTAWSVMESPVAQNLHGIHYLAPDKAWAVGDQGTILYFNGNEWAQQSSQTNVTLHGVHFVNENFGWAVGEAILHYDGNEWQVALEETQLQAVHFYDTNEGWAVGIDEVLKYEAGNWSTHPGNFEFSFYTDVQMTGPASGWLCGHTLGGSKVFMEYDGTNWQTADNGAQPGYGLSFTDHNQGWVLHNQTMPLFDRNFIYKVSGGNWEKDHAMGWWGPQFTAVDATQPDLALVTTDAGHILQHANGNWTTANGMAHEPIYAIDFVDSGKIWAATGLNGLQYYEGGSWTTILHEAEYSHTYVRFFGPDVGWALAGKLDPELFEIAARVYKYSEGSWATVYEDDDFAIVGPMYAIDENHARLFQTNPVKMLGFSPQGVEETPVPLISEAYAIYFSDYQTGWLAGWHIAADKRGIIFKYADGEWITQYENPAQLINDFSFLDDGTAYAVGEEGLLLHYDGTTWVELSSPTTVDLTAVKMIDHQSGWAAGEGGIVLYFDGSQWEIKEAGLGASIFSIAYAGSDFVLMGGVHGALFATQPLPVGLQTPVGDAESKRLFVYPNPATASIWVRLNTQKPLADMQVELLNPGGQKLLEAKPGSAVFQIDISQLPIGLYLVRLWDGERWFTEKLVVSK